MGRVVRGQIVSVRVDVVPSEQFFFTASLLKQFRLEIEALRSFSGKHKSIAYAISVCLRKK